MKKIITVLFAVLLASYLYGQTETHYSSQYLEKSTKFAATTVGIDLFSLSGGTTSVLRQAGLESVDFGPQLSPRLSIGGIHFWGHADFYVAFPLNFLQMGYDPADLEELEFKEGIETGARIYPWAIKEGTLRPFLGVSFRTRSFSQRSDEYDYLHDAPRYEKVTYPIQAGITYTGSSFLISAAAHYQQEDRFTYYTAPNVPIEVQAEPLSFQLSFVKYWDTDKSMRTKSGIEQANLKHTVLEKENLLSAWYFGIGPSASFQVGENEYFVENHAYLADETVITLTPDITFGRYFSTLDTNVGLSYRGFSATVEGFDSQFDLSRRSVSLEAYKFLFNYLGFVPYVGVTATAHSLQFESEVVSERDIKPALGFIFGWDIRVTKTGTNLLRTNLRYNRNLSLNIDGSRANFSYFEFNFIQWVHFFGRKKAYQKYSG
jgi:hypothetical protein